MIRRTRNAMFRLIARLYPTERISGSRVLAAFWRALFYAIGPTQPFVMKTESYRLWADPRKSSLSRAVIRRGHWEPEVTKAFLANLRPGAFVVDGGANFGHFSLTAASVVGPEGLILAFEPDAEAFAELAANAALECRATIRCLNAGLGARRETLPLTRDAANPGGHSLIPSVVWMDGGARMVEIFALDEWLSVAGLAKRPLDLIKIDVQGSEGAVVRHHISVPMLRTAFYALKRDAAPGVDGLTWQDYEADLEHRIEELHDRVQRGAYRAQPSRRRYIPKPDGRQRPLAVAALEDKIVQRAVVAILNAIYEEEFLGFSYGSGPNAASMMRW